MIKTHNPRTAVKLPSESGKLPDRLLSNTSITVSMLRAERFSGIVAENLFEVSINAFKSVNSINTGEGIDPEKEQALTNLHIQWSHAANYCLIRTSKAAAAQTDGRPLGRLLNERTCTVLANNAQN